VVEVVEGSVYEGEEGKTRDELAGGRGVEGGRKALTVGEAGATGR